MNSIETKRTVLPFEQQPRETDRAFAAFSAYLAMGADRSLAKVGQKLGKSRVQMEKWSAKFDWPARVKAHGAHVANIERQAIEALAREKAIAWHSVHEEQRIAEWKARCRALKLAEEVIARWENNGGKCGTLEGIARLLELAHKLGRAAAGMPSEIKEIKGEIKATLEVEWELALKKVYGAKAGAKVIDVVTDRVESASAGLPPSPEAMADKSARQVEGGK